jgi:hypothetical protein
MKKQGIQDRTGPHHDAVDQEGLGLVVHFPLGCLAKINTP